MHWPLIFKYVPNNYKKKIKVDKNLYKLTKFKSLQHRNQEVWLWDLFFVIAEAILIANRRLVNEKGSVESDGVKSVPGNKIRWPVPWSVIISKSKGFPNIYLTKNLVPFIKPTLDTTFTFFTSIGIVPCFSTKLVQFPRRQAT